MKSRFGEIIVIIIFERQHRRSYISVGGCQEQKGVTFMGLINGTTRGKKSHCILGSGGRDNRGIRVYGRGL